MITAGLGLLLTACFVDGRDVPSPTSVPNDRSGESTGTPESSAPPDSGAPDGLTQALVTRVVDGDTIVVSIGGKEFRVRYIGIDTPETVDPRRPVGCFGVEASKRNSELVDGMTIGLERDVSETDSFGRLLRYVWVGDQMVNATLVEEGYATASAYPPDVRYSDTFVELQSEARSEERGLWGDVCSSPTPSLAEGACEYSGTSAPIIKGNISQSTGERIFHVPGGDFYDVTIIDEASGERWFCAEAEALDAGWRKSLR
jgi:micrococcal nuclease